MFERLIKSVIVAAIFYFSIQPLVAQDTIKVVWMRDQPIVMGELNGKKAYFLVDSGADITILNERDLKKYKIRHRKSISKGNVITGLVSKYEQSMMVAVNADLYLNNKKIDACFRIFDITNIKESLGRDIGVWINGIIGSDMMNQYNFVIDYGNQEIHFTHLTSQSNSCL